MHKQHVILGLHHVSDPETDVATLGIQLIYLSVYFSRRPRLSAPHQLNLHKQSNVHVKPRRPLWTTRRSVLIPLVTTHYWLQIPIQPQTRSVIDDLYLSLLHFYCLKYSCMVQLSPLVTNFQSKQYRLRYPLYFASPLPPKL